MASLDTKAQLDPRLIKWVGLLFLEVVVLLIVGVTLVGPRWQDLQKMRRQLGEDKEKVVALSSKVELLEATLPQLLSQYPFVNEQAILLGKDVGLAITSVKQLAAQAGIQVVEYEVNPGEVYQAEEKPAGESKKGTERTNGVQILDLQVTVAGDLVGIRSFMELVDTSLPLKSLNEVQIKVIEGVEQVGSLFELSVKLATYYIPVVAETNPAELLKPVAEDELAIITRLSSFVRPQAVGEVEVEGGNQQLFGL